MTGIGKVVNDKLVNDAAYVHKADWSEAELALVSVIFRGKRRAGTISLTRRYDKARRKLAK